jgi:hypothetical protein
MLKIDTHIHTFASFDCLSHPVDVVKTAKARGLDRICITDHNAIHGALIAKEFAPEFVIVGEEISTTHGEILAFFVTNLVPKNLSPQETIARLKEQGAVISISHPFDPYREHWNEQLLESLLPDIDAVEGFNARSLKAIYNQTAVEFATSQNLPTTAGSDAHTLQEVGAAYIKIPTFISAEQFRRNLHQATLHGQLSPKKVRLYSTTNKVRRWLRTRFDANYRRLVDNES